MKALSLAAALAIALAAGAPRGTQAQTGPAHSGQADVALVLAVDVSGSVDEGRFKLQREGIAAALESDEFAAALAGGGNQTIEIAVVEWAEEQSVVVPWTIVRNREDVLAVTDRLRRAERSWLHVRTDANGGIAAADHLFTSKPLPAMRQVIDVSGDGRQNSGEMAAAVARDDAVARGAIINGLPWLRRLRRRLPEETDARGGGACTRRDRRDRPQARPLIASRLRQRRAKKGGPEGPP